MTSGRHRPKHRTLAWNLGGLAAALIAFGLWASAANGFFGLVQSIYFTTALYAIVGAMVASRQPRNSVGWLMIAMALITGLSMLPFDLGDWMIAARIEPHTIGVGALWLGSWLWVVPFGLGLPLILTRFPRGSISGHWLAVDALSATGTVLFAFAMAARPGPIYPVGLIPNPLGQPRQAQTIALISALGLILLVAGYGMAVLSIGLRMRRARGDERQQLKWLVAASGLLVATLGVGVGAHVAYHLPLLPALVPVSVDSLTLPVAVGVAILRYRLYDLDLIINKAFVYVGLTAILAGLYTSVIGVSQRLFVAYTGQRSDSALLLTAFVVATAFTPVRDGLQKIANRRLALRDPADAMQKLAIGIDSVVKVVDTQRIARQLVQDAIELFEADGGQLYLDRHDLKRPFHAIGRIGKAEAVVVLHGNKQVVGRLVLGSRRGDAEYSRREMAALQSAADALGEAVVLAWDSNSGPRPKLPRAQRAPACVSAVRD